MDASGDARVRKPVLRGSEEKERLANLRRAVLGQGADCKKWL